MTQDSDIPSISVIKKGGPAQEVASLQVMLVELQEREATREQELKRLSDVVQQLTQMSAIECILTNGFDKLSISSHRCAIWRPNELRWTSRQKTARHALRASSMH